MKKKAKKKSIKKSKPENKQPYVQIAIGLVIGIIVGIAFAGVALKTTPSLIQTSCQIDIQTLYEKPCTVTEDCYGRLELCSKSLHKCMTTVQIDKTDLRNIRIPDNEEECESNGGIWKAEIIPTESN